jgi:hypothetical protein
MRQLEISQLVPLLAIAVRKTGRLVNLPPNASFQTSWKLKSIVGESPGRCRSPLIRSPTTAVHSSVLSMRFNLLSLSLSDGLAGRYHSSTRATSLGVIEQWNSRLDCDVLLAVARLELRFIPLSCE